MIAELSRLRAPQIAERADLAVLPIGAIEQHGAHLPVGTDAIIADELARRALARIAPDTRAILLPLVAAGRSIEHLGFPGTLTLRADTLLAVCRDLGRSVHAAGFRSLLIVNGHGGQPGLLETVARDIRAETGLRVFVISTARLGHPDSLVIPDPHDIHAAFSETSVMLALHPELVDMALAAPDGQGLDAAFGADGALTLEGDTPTAWLTRDLAASGVVGDPTAATASVGEAIVEHQVARLARVIDEAAAFRFPGEDA